MAHFGYHMTDEEAYSVRSLGMPYAPEHFKKLYGEDFDYDKVHTYRRKLTDQVLDEGPIEAKPGAEELLKYLRKRCAYSDCHRRRCGAQQQSAEESGIV